MVWTPSCPTGEWRVFPPNGVALRRASRVHGCAALVEPGVVIPVAVMKTDTPCHVVPCRVV